MSICAFVGFFTLYALLIDSAFCSFNFPISNFNDSFYPFFGNDHVSVQDEGNLVQLSLDNQTGAGIVSQHTYNHSYFSASIKLPSNYTVGVVVAFYASNNQEFPKTHDEIDFEFLGNVSSNSWVLQTNMHGGHSVLRSREERYHLWFDPTISFHKYSILWTPDTIMFYIDDVPIRVTLKIDAMGRDYPSKPMKLYAMIQDRSNWKTDGGKTAINYAYAPFVATYSNFVLRGGAENFTGLTNEEVIKMKQFINRLMFYSYCSDPLREPLPECPLFN